MTFESDLLEAKASGRKFGIAVDVATKERRVVYWSQEEIANVAQAQAEINKQNKSRPSLESVVTVLKEKGILSEEDLTASKEVV